jgi:HSP20 family protein
MSITRYNVVLNDFVPTSFSQLADRFFNESVERSGGSAYTFQPKADIIEGEKSFDILLAVPGMKKEDFKIDLNDRELTVSGERKHSAEKNDKFYRSFQTDYGSFSRTFVLPEAVDVEKIEAKYENGILELVVPKDEKKLLKTTIQVA